MTLLIHDLFPYEWALYEGLVPADTCVITPKESGIQKCKGCLSCWYRTPGRCIQSDGFDELPRLFGEASTLVFITEIVYGGFSPEGKTVLDRSLGYLLPTLAMRKEKLYRNARFNFVPPLKILAYGGTQIEQEHFKGMAAALGKTLDLDNVQVSFAFSREEMNIGEVF